MTDELVWYAAYGSNLNPDRFICYIEGSRTKFSEKEMNGCEDKTHPRSTEIFEDSYEMYFAKRSSLWDGGVCFIRKGDSKTLFNLCLISIEQFKDVLFQECGLNDMDREIDLELKTQDYFFDDRSWYGRILFLGELEVYPIYTMTAPEDFTDELCNPSRYYFFHIIKGLYEIHDLTEKEIRNYLIEKKGVMKGPNQDWLLKFIKMKTKIFISNFKMAPHRDRDNNEAQERDTY